MTARNRKGKPGREVPPGSRRPASSVAVRRALRRGPAYQDSRLVLGTINYALMGMAVVAAVVGFYLLSIGESVLSPILIVLSYCVIIPAGLLIERKAKGAKSPGSGG